MTTRMQVTLPEELLQRARSRSGQLGISVAEYIRRLLAADAEPEPAPTDISGLFDLGDSGGSDIARHEDSYLAGAVHDR